MFTDFIIIFHWQTQQQIFLNVVIDIPNTVSEKEIVLYNIGNAARKREAPPDSKNTIDWEFSTWAFKIQ